MWDAIRNAWIEYSFLFTFLSFGINVVAGVAAVVVVVVVIINAVWVVDDVVAVVFVLIGVVINPFEVINVVVEVLEVVAVVVVVAVAVKDRHVINANDVFSSFHVKSFEESKYKFVITSLREIFNQINLILTFCGKLLKAKKPLRNSLRLKRIIWLHYN